MADPDQESRRGARLAESVVVAFALVTRREDRNVAWTVDLEERNVPCAAERDHELAQ